MNRKFVSKSNFVLRIVLNKKESIDILKDFIESILKIEIKNFKFTLYSPCAKHCCHTLFILALIKLTTIIL